jgi:DNA repair photolyase
MKNKVIQVPCVMEPIAKAPGFQKKQLADYKLDLLGLCGFGCVYCSSNQGNYLRIRREKFADATEQQIGERVLPADDPSLTFEWPDVLETLEKQLERRPRDWGSGQVLVVSMLTDAFSPNLVKTGVTEKALRLILARTGFRIRVLTKSAIVGKDRWIELFSEHRDRFVVGLSIGTTDREWASKIEVGTSLPSARLRALRRLQDAGVPTFGMLCPVFPDMLQDGRFEDLVDAHRPELLEHIWCEPFNDRDNWRIVRDGYEKESIGYTWLTETYEEKRKDRWSACARDLYTRLKEKGQKEGWLDKLRYLLYEDKVTKEDAPSFAGLKGVLLQCTPNEDGCSPNKHIARLQADLTVRNDAQSGELTEDGSPEQSQTVHRIAVWAQSRGVSKKEASEAIAATASRWEPNPSPEQVRAQVARVYVASVAGPCSRPQDRPPTADEVLKWAGISSLTAQSSMTEVENSLRFVAKLSRDLDRLRGETVRQGATRRLKQIGIGGSRILIQEAFSDAGRVVPSGSPDDQCSEEPTPWPDEVDGADLLDGIVGVFKRYLALPDGSAEAFALWTLHTYTIDAASVSPFLALNSPEKRCGKTSALTLLDALVKKPLTASNITPAALFRSVEEWRPTLLIDEADTFIRKSDDLRGPRL